MLVTILSHDSQTRRFTIRRRPAAGWEVIDEHDSHVLRRAIYFDWHRVERALAMFQREEALLRASGWIAVG